MRFFHRSGLGVLLLVSLALGAGGCVSRSKAPPVAVFPADPDPAATIEQARGRAASSGRRVLLTFGANWCSDSRSMYRRLTADARIAPLVRERYELVLIDVGKRDGPDWDSAVVRQYGRPFAGRGIPALVVLDAEGRQLTTSTNNPLRDTAHRHPRRLRRFLETWAGP